MLCGLVRLGGYPFEEPGVGEGRRAATALGASAACLKDKLFAASTVAGGFATRGVASGWSVVVCYLYYVRLYGANATGNKSQNTSKVRTLAGPGGTSGVDARRAA